MSVISRSALESSSLADLHEIASEIGLDGYRRLRKADLVATIVERQGGEDADGPGAANGADAADGPGAADALDGTDVADDDGAARPVRRSRRGGRGRSRARERDSGDGAAAEDERGEPAEHPGRSRLSRDDERGESDDRPSRSRRSRNGARGDGEERVASGTVELLPNGSGFLRVAPPEPSDDDVYISAAQVRRCELVAGDEVTGPVRPPRRSERFPSLIRIDTINGRAADEVAEGTKYDDLPCTYATERLAFDADDDPTLKAIEWLTPLGRGSRVAIVGGPRAGKTEALRRMAVALARQEDLECSVVLAGVRPEEIGDWKQGSLEPVVALCLGVAADTLGQAVERAVETGRRVAARGGQAVVLIDTLEQLPPPVARRALAAARNIAGGGSLTIIATAREPLGGETTVIALNALLASSGRIPALDLGVSGTVRPELLVGDKGAEAIAEARAAALAG